MIRLLNLRLWSYLCFDVIEGWRADDGEADQEDVGLGVG
jgi:hypothetical protein